MSISRKPGAVSGALAALVVLSMALPALAEHELKAKPDPAPLHEIAPTGPGGFYFLLDFSAGNTENSGTNADFEVDLGYTAAFGMGVGYRAGPIRLEGEIYNHFFHVQVSEAGPAAPFPDPNFDGWVTAQGLMASVFYDFPTAGRARPYLGAGYGIAEVEASYYNSCFVFCLFPIEVVDDRDQVAAWQAMAGISLPAWSPGTEWFIGYRYFGTADLNFVTFNGTAFTQDGLKSHSVNAGFRFYF